MSVYQIPDIAEEAILTRITGEQMVLRLFKNDVLGGLSEDEIAALDETDFTASNFTGYSAKTLTGGSWTVTGGQPTEAVYAEQTFTCTANITAQDVYGYWIVASASGELRGFRQFDAPITIEFNGDAVKITPALHLSNKEDLMPVGSMTQYGAATAPNGWLLCDGSAVSRTTYANLFAAISTTYGSGDGSTTFNVPDMRQRFPLGKASSGTGASLGDTGGDIDHVHSVDSADGSTSYAKIQTAVAGHMVYDQKTTETWTYDVKFDPDGGIKSAQSSTSTAAAGLGGDTDDNNPPYNTVNYIIRY